MLCPLCFCRLPKKEQHVADVLLFVLPAKSLTANTCCHVFFGPIYQSAVGKPESVSICEQLWPLFVDLVSVVKSLKVVWAGAFPVAPPNEASFSELQPSDFLPGGALANSLQKRFARAPKICLMFGRRNLN
jgi:hypothetical protein